MSELFPTPKFRPDSVMLARDPEVLRLMLAFYVSPGAKVLDVTAQRRRMWNGVEWPGVVYADIDPEMKPDILADFRALPVPDGCFDVIVFDPPHIPAAAASKESGEEYRDHYGIALAPHADNISGYFAPFLKEAHRVLRREGVIFAKLKDFVHNHAYQWTLADFISAVRNQDGLTPCDLIVKRDPCGGNLKSSRWKKAHHARNSHTWWIVVRKGGCESRALKNQSSI